METLLPMSPTNCIAEQLDPLLLVSATDLAFAISHVIDNSPTQYETTVSNYDLTTILEELTGENLTMVGSGGFSTVFVHPHDNTKVIKISRDIEGDVWYNFITCMNHDSPWFPKVYAIDNHEWCTIAVLDRLTPTFIDNDECRIATDVIQVAEEIRLDQDTTEEHIVKLLLRTVHGSKEQYTTTARKYIPVVYEFINILKQFDHLNIDYIDDLCRKNIMMLGDQLIYNDPVA